MRISQRILDETNRRYRERIASMGGVSGPAQALFQQLAPECLRATKQRQDVPLSEHGLRCLGESFFDATKPRRMIEGKVLSTAGPNAHGDSYVAAGVRFSLPLPLMSEHSKLAGRILAVTPWLDGSITFRAEISNTGMDFADDLWADITARKIDCSSFAARSLTGVGKGLISSWSLEEISAVLNGADKGAVLTRCYEKLSGERLGRAVTREIWSGPLTTFDEVNMEPRATARPPKKESTIATAASLLTRLRAELNSLK